MPRGIPNPKSQDDTMSNEQATLTNEPTNRVTDHKPATDADHSRPAEAPEGKSFRVLLKRNYRPRGKYKKVDLAGEAHAPDKVAADKDAGLEDKVKSGWVIEIPLDEAKDIIRAGIAERADELPA